MIINLKNKDTLIVDDFKLKCCIGKKGLTKSKKEGDYCTPKGTFTLGTLYYRKDRVNKPSVNFKTKVIKSNMGWCDDPKNKYYNKEVKINNVPQYEKLFRKDNKYDYLLVINYNIKKIIPNNGSAIFIHLTKKYSPTKGCVTLAKKDFLIMLKLINNKTKIKIN